MTNREYIQSKLTGLDVPESVFIDAGMDANDEYFPSEENGRKFVSVVEQIMFLPRRKSVSESGFSMSWDYADLNKLYLWLCRRYGVKPSEDVLGMSGLSSVIDKTDTW